MKTLKAVFVIDKHVRAESTKLMKFINKQECLLSQIKDKPKITIKLENLSPFSFGLVSWEKFTDHSSLTVLKELFDVITELINFFQCYFWKTINHHHSLRDITLLWLLCQYISKQLCKYKFEFIIYLLEILCPQSIIRKSLSQNKFK